VVLLGQHMQVGQFVALETLQILIEIREYSIHGIAILLDYHTTSRPLLLRGPIVNSAPNRDLIDLSTNKTAM
jgi:hypothetical protein